MLKEYLALCIKQPTDISLTFLLHGVSERNGKKKKVLSCGCHLSSYLVRTLSDLGSVNITQKKKLPLLLCKSRKVEAKRSPYPLPCKVSTEPVQFAENTCLVELAAPGSRLAGFHSLGAWLRPGHCPHQISPGSSRS